MSSFSAVAAERYCCNQYEPSGFFPTHPILLCVCLASACDTTQQELESTINEALDWLDETPDAELEDLEDKKKEVEQIANPIMKDLYQQAPQGGAEEDFDFGDDEL